MPHRLPLFTCVALAAVAGAAWGDSARTSGPPAQAVAGPAAVAHAELLPVDDPFPIRRFRANEARLADLLKPADSDPLVRLPRGDFEARVRAAGRAAAEARDLPRVTETRFQASLVGSDLVGTAELDLTSATAAGSFLPIDPLRLALGRATWADGREALLGLPAGATAAGVWVDRPGRQTLKFEWSLAGITEPGEQRFELRVPGSLTALLELELPAGRVPTVSAADVLLTGPFAIPGKSNSLWRFRFGGRPRLDFAVRPAGNPGVTAAASLRAVYDLTPGQLTCAFEYELRPAKGAVGEWVFEVAPGLRVTNVEVNNRAGWSVDPAAAPEAPRRLRVTLRQPGAGGKVLVSAVAPFPDPARPGNHPLPGVRPLGATLDDETVEVRLAPELRAANWNAGDYRVTESHVLPDMTHEITLTGTLLPAGADRLFRRLPTVQTAPVEADFTTLEQVAWRLDADQAAATVRVGVRVRRGPLFQIAVKVPPGYTLGRATAIPDDLVASTRSTGGTVLVEFAHPLGTGQGAEFAFEFRGPALGPVTQRVAFPVFTPLGPAERAGVLGVFPGAVWSAEIRPGVGTVPVGWLDLDSPRPPSGGSAAFRYHADNPDGWVNLTPAQSEFTAEATVGIRHTSAGVVGATALALRVRRGGLGFVAVLEPANGVEGRTWRVVSGGNAVAAAAAVPVTLFAGPFAFAAAGADSPHLWLVRFARPVTGELILETSVVIPTDPEDDSSLPGADAATRLTVWGATEWRAAAAPGVRVPEPPSAPQGWGFTGLYLVTAVRGSGDVVAVFGGTATAGGPALPVALPAGAEVRAASVGGRWVEPGSLRLADGVLSLPVHGTGPVRFEVRYRLPVEPGGVARQVRSPVPALPAPGGEVRRWWAFGPSVLPGWPVWAWDRESPADLPELLGAHPVSGPGSVVWRSSLDEVRVATARLADVVGVAMAAALFALAAAGVRRRHPFCALLALGGLLAVGAGFLLGPPWWQRAAAVPLVVGLAGAAVVVVARGHRSRLPAALAAAGGVCVLTGPDTAAQPVAPAVVVILPRDANGREAVVAPKSVLDRLAAVASPAPPGVLLTSAEYAATADDTTSRVTAKFVAHAFDAGAVASLPLADARLERVTVNGAAAFAAHPRPGVYTVPLSGRGRHEIEVRFTVSVSGTGTEREFRFGVPEGPAAKVVADLPGSAKQAQVVGRVGRQTVTAGRRVRLETDAGAARAVQVRWRDGAGGTAAFKVREGCVWDVSEAGAELTACYIVRIEQGTVSSLRFDVPAELDPLGVAVRSLEPGGTASLRDWSLDAENNGFRPLRLDFQGPTAGRVLVVLTLAPRKPVTRQPVLRFPKVAATGGGEPDAVYGLRAKGVAVEDWARGGVIDFSPDALTRDFAAVPDLRLAPNSPVRVFRPTPTGIPELRPTLRLAAELPGVTLDTAWHLAPHRADADGVLKWVGKESVALVEFTLPAAKVTEVRGPDVAAWSQAGARVQVWLKRPSKEGELAWSATVTKPALAFDAVTPQVADAKLTTDTVRIRPAPGFAVRVERDRGWTASESDALAFDTTNAGAPPVRVIASAKPPVLRDGEMGWLRPTPKPAPTPVTPVPPVKAVAPPPPGSGAPVGPPPESPPRWATAVWGASAWCATVLFLALVLVRAPRGSWPEQLGLVGGLFGTAVAGGWWVGMAAWGAARAAWLAAVVVRGEGLWPEEVASARES
jgi:hypothetical protein